MHLQIERLNLEVRGGGRHQAATAERQYNSHCLLLASVALACLLVLFFWTTSYHLLEVTSSVVAEEGNVRVTLVEDEGYRHLATWLVSPFMDRSTEQLAKTAE